MTEPTAEQVNAERERAHVLLEALCYPCISVERPGMKHDEDCTMLATALARVRIEAHAAGRDEGLRDAALAAAAHDGCDGACHESWEIEDEIEALRGRT